MHDLNPTKAVTLSSSNDTNTKTSQTLTPELTKEMDEFFQNKKMFGLCIAIQLSLLAEWDLKKLKDKSLNQIQKMVKSDEKKRLFFKNHKRQISLILENMINTLSMEEQKKLFLKQLPSEFFVFYFNNPIAKKCRYEKLIVVFHETFLSPLDENNFNLSEKQKKSLSTTLMPALEICSEKLEYTQALSKSIFMGYLFSSVQAFLLLIALYEVIWNINGLANIKLLARVFFEILLIGVTFLLMDRRKTETCGYTRKQWRAYVNSETRHSLNKIEIFDENKDPVDNQSLQVTYLPITCSKAPLCDTPPPIVDQEANTSQRNPKTKKSSVASEEQKSFSIIPRFFTKKTVCWPAEDIIGWKREKGNIYSDMSLVRKFTGTNRHLYGLFNKPALKKQLKQTSKEYKSYWSQWNKGIIVPPTCNSGVKELLRSVKEKIKIKDLQVTCFFQWELKILKQLYRCGGIEASTVLDSAGEQHTVINFCWHWDKGPGKS